MVFSVILIKYKRFTSYIVAWLSASLYGILDELHQNFVPGRGAALTDVRLDVLSALAGVAAAAVVIEIWRKWNFEACQAPNTTSLAKLDLKRVNRYLP